MSDKMPQALRKHVVILGNINSGKSTLFNALTGQDTAIVSPFPGTTTDPVSKAMELIPFGPIVLIDTAGFGDESALGAKRMHKTEMMRRRADAAIYAADINNFNQKYYDLFYKSGMAHLLVFTKCSPATKEKERSFALQFPDSIFIGEDINIDHLRSRLSRLLLTLQPDNPPIVGNLLPTGSHVVLVTPIDLEAPKGRLILPQVQTLRDCLDHSINATICLPEMLGDVIARLGDIQLVITDSQVFDYVNKIVPPNIMLTSFSMLLSNQKSEFMELIHGIEGISKLDDGDIVLILEGCTHNHTHEDIGRVKLPHLLQKRTGKRLSFAYFSGYDFPDELSKYKLAVHCGGCMLSRREISARLSEMKSAELPVINYGVLLAWGAGTLERGIEIFKNPPINTPSHS